MKRLAALALISCLCLAWLLACSQPTNNTQSMRTTPYPTLTPLPTAQPSPSVSRTNSAKNINLANLNSSDRAALNMGNLKGSRSGNVETFTPTPVSSAPSNLGVTMAGYNALRNGMSYSEAIRILGTSGTELSSGGSEYGYATVMYQWKGSDGFSNMTAMFQNDRLINKAQFGLK